MTAADEFEHGGLVEANLAYAPHCTIALGVGAGFVVLAAATLALAVVARAWALLFAPVSAACMAAAMFVRATLAGPDWAGKYLAACALASVGGAVLAALTLVMGVLAATARPTYVRAAITAAIVYVVAASACAGVAASGDRRRAHSVHMATAAAIVVVAGAGACASVRGGGVRGVVAGVVALCAAAGGMVRVAQAMVPLDRAINASEAAWYLGVPLPVAVGLAAVVCANAPRMFGARARVRQPLYAYPYDARGQYSYPVRVAQAPPVRKAGAEGTRDLIDA